MEAKFKHLEFIQAAIARMSTLSSLYKGWAITLAAALSALAATRSTVALGVVVVITTLMFWGLDGYYLWLERGFVALYRKVVETPESEIDFSMTPIKSDQWRGWLMACRRPHLSVFYGTIILVDVIGTLVLRSV